MGLANKDIAKELEELYESIVKTEAMITVPLPPPHIQQMSAFSPAFIEYIKHNENGTKVGYRNGKWFPYTDPTGILHIGYGHVIEPGENFKAGLSDTQVTHLLEHDLGRANSRARDHINRNFGRNAWESLDQKRREMLIDFMFNLGTLNSHPKFVKAVMHNDISGMKREYERTMTTKSGQHVPIAGRNTAFFNTFLKNYSGGYYVASN